VVHPEPASGGGQGRPDDEDGARRDHDEGDDDRHLSRLGRGLPRRFPRAIGSVGASVAPLPGRAPVTAMRCAPGRKRSRLVGDPMPEVRPYRRRMTTPTRTPATLLSVLPVTTAWGGAIAVVMVPVGASLVSTIATGDVEHLRFLVLLAPAMLIAAFAAAAFGSAVGALAGLPDWLLRCRPRWRLLGILSAVVILATSVGVTCAMVPPAVGFLLLVPLPASTFVVVATAAAAAITSVVIAIHRRPERRRAVRAAPADALSLVAA
jgi:hypothetical protein